MVVEVVATVVEAAAIEVVEVVVMVVEVAADTAGVAVGTEIAIKHLK
jgi:hypothetical protein